MNYIKVGGLARLRYGPYHPMMVTALEDNGLTARCEWRGRPVQLTQEQMSGAEPIPEMVTNSEPIPVGLLVPVVLREPSCERME